MEISILVQSQILPKGSGYLFADFLSTLPSMGPPRVDCLCKRRFGRGALGLAEAGVAVRGVADCAWPGSRFVALEGDEEGCWLSLTPFRFVCTRGMEGFFILLCAGGGLEAITAAIVTGRQPSSTPSCLCSKERVLSSRLSSTHLRVLCDVGDQTRMLRGKAFEMVVGMAPTTSKFGLDKDFDVTRCSRSLAIVRRFSVVNWDHTVAMA